MPTTYETASDGVLLLLKQQLAKRHLELVECKATITIIMASNEKGPAVKHHGTAALAKVRIVSVDKRVNNSNDVEILVDVKEWASLDENQRLALINHELLHVARKEYKPKKLAQLRKDNPDHPAWKLDCHGRPVLGTVPADVTPGDGFALCIKWHGKSAVEFVTAQRFSAFAEKALAEREKGAK